MRRLLIALSIMAGAAGPAGATPACDRLVETAWLNPDGSARIVVDAQCPSGTGSPLVLPVTADLGALTVEGVTGAKVSPATDGSPRLLITFPGPAGSPVTVHVTGTAAGVAPALSSPPGPFGDRTMTYRFVNTTPTRFASVTVRIVLPRGYVVSAVDSAAPSTATGSPVSLTVLEGRHTVVVAVDDVALGDAASVAFRCRTRGTPAVLMVILAALAATYLVVFRDLPGGRATPVAQ